MTPEERQQVMEFLREGVFSDRTDIMSNRRIGNYAPCIYCSEIDVEMLLKFLGTTPSLFSVTKFHNSITEYICEAINEKLSRDRAEAQLKQENEKCDGRMNAFPTREEYESEPMKYDSELDNREDKK